MSTRSAEAILPGQPDTKRPRTDSPATGASFDIAAIRAQIAARKAQGETKPSLAGTPPPTAAPSQSTDLTAIRAQIAAKKAQLKAGTSSSTPPSPSVPPKPAGTASLPPPATMDTSIAERLAAAKARIEAMNARAKNPYLSGAGSMPKADSPAPAAPIGTSSIALHPLLMGEATQQQQKEKNEKKKERDRYKTMAPKFSTVKANKSLAPPEPVRPVVTAPVLNPYASTPVSNTPAQEDAPAPSRRSKKLQFSQPGKYVRQGDTKRNEQKMEALRLRIQDASRKAGLDSEFDTLERSLKRQPPPEVEWWDRAILPEGGNYDDINGAMDFIVTADVPLITHLVQHPIPIAAPGDRRQAERGLMLTKKEQKKMRRQRRQAELEDKRDRQKMGLIPADPPKVRLANLWKVLTSDAVQDPTRIEAKVKREVAMRAHNHEKDNQQRKLTAEERKEKEYAAMQARERKGIYGAAFKIKYLTNGRHKYKVRETAKRDLLSGICIFHPSFALVLVEGVDKGVKHYKKLLLSRIDWTEEARPLEESADADEEDGGPSMSRHTQQGPESLEDNTCELIWEGEVPERTFKVFRARHAETDTKAKEWLTSRYEGYWDLAKRHVWKGEDL